MYIGTGGKGVVVLSKKDFDILMNSKAHMGYELDYVEKSTSVLLRDCQFDDFTRGRIESLNYSSREGLKWLKISEDVERRIGR